MRDPVIAWDFDKAVTRRLLFWDKDLKAADRNRLAAAIWGADTGEQTAEDEEEQMMANIPVYADGLSDRRVS